jgi:hypothetical protein
MAVNGAAWSGTGVGAFNHLGKVINVAATRAATAMASTAGNTTATGRPVGRTVARGSELSKVG